jgi:hypothetical protein
MTPAQFNLIITILQYISISLWIIAGVQLGRWIFDIIDRIKAGDM